MTKTLPLMIAAISLGAAAVYAADRQWLHALYWTAAAVLTLCVTMMGR